MTIATPDRNKAIYRTYHDEILTKRFHSTSPIRRHAHRTQYQFFVDAIPAGSRVLDAGCGEGVLSVLLAKKGCQVTGVDLSEPNIASSKAYAVAEGVAERTTFSVADLEHLPFEDHAFEYVVSSHVLEHVPDFAQGARELNRVARKCLLVAIPTCFTPAAMVLLGGDAYWTFSRRTPYAFWYGLLRVLCALLRGEEGVNEGYAGHQELIHIRRFPWRGKKSLQAAGLSVLSYRGSSYVFPYLSFLLPLSRLLETMAWLPLIRECGFGVTYVCDPLKNGAPRGD